MPVKAAAGAAKKKKGNKVSTGGEAFTASEKRYAALLADPCNAPIARGVFGDGLGSMAARYETDFVLTPAGTNTAGAVCFSPYGAYIRSGAVDSDTANITFTSSVPAPGTGQLNNASRFRALAACMQVMWTGSEQNRQGVISLGNAPAFSSTLPSISPSDVRSYCPYVFRTPGQVVGMKWRPTDEDIQWHKYAQGPYDETRNNGIWLSWAGFPAGQTIRVRVVYVVEWDPEMTINLGVLPQAYGDAGKLDDGLWSKSLRLLDRTGHWLLDNAEALGYGAYKLAAAVI